MKIHSQPATLSGERKVLVVAREGVTIRRERKKVGGGYYTRDYMTFPWPWKKED